MARLPAAATAFVGRRRELAAARRLLSATRLLTLTGTAGVGKTRLAMELARRASVGEVWFVELASLRDARAPARALAASTGLAERREPVELAEGLSGRAGLVVLDNCEHLVEASAELVVALLAGCPELRILSTSREALGVRGEVVWQVPGLQLPDLTRHPASGRLRACDAVAFFAQSAARRMPGFAIADHQLAVVAGICRRLDTNPLALELAAARIAHLTLEEMERRLDGSFAILSAPGRVSADRHRSLWTAIDWSHDLLTDPDRALFRRLSVFRGGFGLDAAAAVAGSPDVLAGVARLVDKSLVLSLATSGTPRYRLLETLREHGQRRLRESGEEAEVRARHAAWFLGMAERAGPLLRGPEAVGALDGLELEHDNLRAALDWGVERDPTTAARLASVLGEFWTQRGYLSEGRERLERCLAVLEGPDEHAFSLLLAAANLALRQSDFPGCRRYLELLLAGSLAAGDRSAEAHAHDLLGRVALEEGSLDLADDELAVAMRRFSELEDRGGEARVHWHLNMLTRRRGDLEASRHHIERFRAVAEAVTNPRAIGHAHMALAFHDHALGDRDEMARDLGAALRLLGAVADRWSLANALRLTAVMAVERGAKEQALVLLEAAEGMDEAIGARPGQALTRLAVEWRARALHGTPASAARAAAARGRRMALGEAVDFALGTLGAGAGVAAGGLTRREVEVARLMAAGATDREIGARLGISLRTVEKHAENVRSKLGVESRSAVGEAIAAT